MRPFREDWLEERFDTTHGLYAAAVDEEETGDSDAEVTMGFAHDLAVIRLLSTTADPAPRDRLRCRKPHVSQGRTTIPRAR